MIHTIVAAYIRNSYSNNPNIPNDTFLGIVIGDINKEHGNRMYNVITKL